MTDAEIRDIFLAHGFKIQGGFTDLKPYVYEAARALLKFEHQRLSDDLLRLAKESEDKSEKYEERNMIEDALLKEGMAMGFNMFRRRLTT